MPLTIKHPIPASFRPVHPGHSLLRFGAAMMIMLVFGVAAHGQGANRNAATWYRRAIEQYNRTFTQQQRDAVSNYLDNPGGAPPAEVREVINQSQTIFNFIRKGSAQSYC